MNISVKMLEVRKNVVNLGGEMVHNAQLVSADRLQRKLIAGIALTGTLCGVL